MDYSYRTRGVCSMQIDFHLDGDVVRDVRFTGGCNGNLKAISKLVEGMTVDQIEGYLKGNTCGRNTTSCADQLAIAVRQAWNQAQAG
ncbi:MAG: TIGR03905 family TSCPD domain-containing protein [Oscillospiraceae bacterium]|nr:TIGR03905 family TSCPD domain-containing protein [Oscillospiraceae bacterium]MBQ9374066.1 TIGR03905 family TSCPD domain-containing protein [Oscillospiraceae bacterium]